MPVKQKAKTVRLELRIPRTLDAALSRAAKQTGISKASYVRSLLTQWRQAKLPFSPSG